MRFLAFIFISFLAINSFGQEKKDRLPTYFGLQVRPIFPTQFIGEKTLFIQDNASGLETSITQKLGLSFGGTVRAGITKLIAFETGLNFTQRNFDITMALPDSNSYGTANMSFIEYDLPVNALIYIQLSEEFFMNASLGASITYQPTDTRVYTRPAGGIHYYSHYGLRDRRVGAGANVNVGFEYRTKKSGFFYIGGSARVPFSALFTLGMIHDYGANTTELSGPVNGSFLALDLKYFFPLIRNKGPQFENGPIE